mmetsp:Transcript_77510/g.240088  ORF Transcript_77510/g.240088 Transcript_77510/m.240088 type:complete len:90 (+) Transcript_77510:125-394(+)
MDARLDDLRSTLRGALTNVERAMDGKGADAQQALRRLRQEREEVNAEWDQLEAERVSLAEAHAEVDAKLEEVGKLKADLLAQKKVSSCR